MYDHHVSVSSWGTSAPAAMHVPGVGFSALPQLSEQVLPERFVESSGALPCALVVGGVLSVSAGTPVELLPGSSGVTA